MRIGSVRTADGGTVPAVEREGRFYPVTAEGGLTGLIASGRPVTDYQVGSAPLAGAVPDVPLRPGKIVAIGLNYLDHIRETGAEPPTRPLVFAKFPSSLVGHDQPVVLDEQITRRVDWEVELAVVIGRRARNVAQDEALSHVYGYTVANDISARDVQFADAQWVRGKSLDTFCPLGPVVVTADEIADPQDLRLWTRVNGEVVQDSSTREMLFTVAQLISFCSHSFTLEPGDVLLTGTPWGCGEFTDPPRHLRPGDVVEVEAERIGTLRNPVTAAG